MRIIIGIKTYTKIKSLSFSPETDVTNSELAVNELSADIFTDDLPMPGCYVALYDEREVMWAHYWLFESVRIDRGVLRIRAQSEMLVLERKTMGAIMYNDAPVSNIVSDIFANVTLYSLDSSLSSMTISGFCPEQTARDRLQWVCLCVGGYVKTYFNDRPEIKPIETEQALIPLSQTFWKPSLTYGDDVTAVVVKAFSYTEGTPSTTDKWVTDGTRNYIQTEQVFTLSNPDASPLAAEHAYKVEDVTIINTGNVSAILTRLSTYFFKRMEVSLDVIDNGEYIPGQKVAAYMDEREIVGGFVKSCDFSFGLQARARLRLVQTDSVPSGGLLIHYMFGDTQIGLARYWFPVGYAYDFENPYIDRTDSAVRFIYRPLTENASGTVTSETENIYEYYEIALRHSDNILLILSVDELSQNEGIVRIS